MARGLSVLIRSRDLANGKAAVATGTGSYAIQLDVTAPTSIAAAARRVGAEFGGLVVLVSNAGISHPQRSGNGFLDSMGSNNLTTAPMANVREVWEANVFGGTQITRAP